MCGICGIIHYGSELPPVRATAFRVLSRCLLDESESRGHDATGICIIQDKKVSVVKDHIQANRFTSSEAYRLVASKISGDNFRSMIGHTRAQTKGSYLYNTNNHPIIAGSVVGVHNGMINNDDHLFSQYSDNIQRAGRVDSEIIFRLIDFYLRNGRTIVEAVQLTSSKLYGSYSCAFITTDSIRYVTIFRNNMSALALCTIPNIEAMVFASTKFILKRALSNGLPLYEDEAEDIPIKDGSIGLRIDTETGKIFDFPLMDTNNHARNMFCGGPYNVL